MLVVSVGFIFYDSVVIFDYDNDFVIGFLVVMVF